MIQLTSSILSADIQNDLVVVVTKDSMVLWNIDDLVHPIDTVHVNAVCIVRFCHSSGEQGRDSVQSVLKPVLSASAQLSTPLKQFAAIQSPFTSTQPQLTSPQPHFTSTQPQLTSQPHFPLSSPYTSTSPYQSLSTPSKPVSVSTTPSLTTTPQQISPPSPLHTSPDTSQHPSFPTASQQFNSPPFNDSFQGPHHYQS